MNTKDLEIFLQLAKDNNMQQTAQAFDCTPSMVSKALKRLEQQCNSQLFSRRGKNILLNDSGRSFQLNAAKIVAEVKQAKSAFGMAGEKTIIKIGAPSILLFRWASVFNKVIGQKYPNCRVEFDAQYEAQALEGVKNGAIDVAVITADIQSAIPNDAVVLPLGEVNMKIACARNHPLLQGAHAISKGTGIEKVIQGQVAAGKIKLPAEQVLAHHFVSTSVSPFCGEARGVGCDGWENQKLHRRISSVVNDFGILAQLVKSGQALAYLPDYWLRELGLVQIDLDEHMKEAREEVLLVSYQSSIAHLLAS